MDAAEAHRLHIHRRFYDLDQFHWGSPTCTSLTRGSRRRTRTSRKGSRSTCGTRSTPTPTATAVNRTRTGGTTVGGQVRSRVAFKACELESWSDGSGRWGHAHPPRGGTSRSTRWFFASRAVRRHEARLQGQGDRGRGLGDGGLLRHRHRLFSNGGATWSSPKVGRGRSDGHRQLERVAQGPRRPARRLRGQRRRPRHHPQGHRREPQLHDDGRDAGAQATHDKAGPRLHVSSYQP